MTNTHHPPTPPAPSVAPAAPAGQLHYERYDDLAPAVGSLSISIAAYWVAIVHAVAAGGLAVLMGLAALMAGPDPAQVAVILVGQAPFGLVALGLGIAGHGPVGGRRWAGPAMWIAGLAPGISVGFYLVLALLSLRIDGRTTLAALGPIAVDLAIVFTLRNRILKERNGPLPVIPIVDPEPPAGSRPPVI